MPRCIPHPFPPGKWSIFLSLRCENNGRVSIHDWPWVAYKHFFINYSIHTTRTDYKNTLRMVEYSRQEYELAVQSVRNAENERNFSVDICRLYEDISFLRLSCDSIALREQADRMFDDYVMHSETLNMDMVWYILDMYKASEMHSRNVDLENEAIALGRQGRLFYKILNLRSKAHTYYRASFDLATSLHPKDMNNCDWFKECKIVLEECQQAKLREEEARKANDRAPYLEKMKDVLDALKSHS